MRLIIAGSRTLTFNISGMQDIIDNLIPLDIDITEIVCGGADGIDTSGGHWAEFQTIKVMNFPANWIEHGKAAGPIRNAQMADYADALLLIWDGQSRGSSNMKQCMIKKGKPIYEVILSRAKN